MLVSGRPKLLQRLHAGVAGVPASLLEQGLAGKAMLWVQPGAFFGYNGTQRSAAHRWLRIRLGCVTSVEVQDVAFQPLA